VNSTPVRVVRITEGVRVIDIGKGLQESEQEWIAYQLRLFLGKLCDKLNPTSY
jgi:hypothetical protein